MIPVEFYFADANLPFDKCALIEFRFVDHTLKHFIIRFMWTLHSKTPEHWVPIKTIASFKRMREYQPEGIDWLLHSLQDSTFLEVDESKTNIRRTTEVEEPKNQFERSVYAVRVLSMRK